MTVTEIYVKLRLEQSVASQHLAILRKAGFVNTVRDGKFIYYSVSKERLVEVHDFSQQLLN
jgi:DNA-binding transcriptional ArsR family regulator